MFQNLFDRSYMFIFVSMVGIAAYSHYIVPVILFYLSMVVYVFSAHSKLLNYQDKNTRTIVYLVVLLLLLATLIMFVIDIGIS